MKTPTFTGVMTVVVTPFDRQGAIDFSGLGKLVDGLVAHGVHWIVPGGTTGEYYAQSVAERKEILSFVAERSTSVATGRW
jgi:4-hydroxy-tetrahydrodipicolinate synthase